ncbi:hypothetical protein [Nocardioides sp. WS12]|uniref:hypothetical protein n=1 Tax=Nocardioides sp. WS12 TaxID=2486272 RepID=UPI0015F98DC4|nr:hypothetical protein [Nocardioides sp. WS12]
MTVAEGRAKDRYQAALVIDEFDSFGAVGIAVLSVITFGWYGAMTDPRHRIEIRRMESGEVVATIAWVRRHAKATLVLGDVQRDLMTLSVGEFRDRYEFEDPVDDA